MVANSDSGQPEESAAEKKPPAELSAGKGEKVRQELTALKATSKAW